MKSGIYISDETWNKLQEEVLTENKNYGRQVLFPPLEIMFDNIRTICEVYAKHPDTCIALLNQVSQPVEKSIYEQKVLQKIKALAETNTDLLLIVDSLANLRTFVGDDPEFLNKTFAREIGILPSKNRNEIFKEIVYKMCHNAITKTTENIKPNQPLLRSKGTYKS